MQNTNLNTSPYFDDFDPNKNFYKVLFRPGYPVQARELTTSQSILQHQIENFGRSIYKDGSMVVPGQVGYDAKYYAVKINPSFAGAPVEAYRTSLVGLTITGATSNVKATVVDTLSATDTQNTSGYITLYVKYITPNSSDNSTATFVDDEDLIATTNIVVGTTTIPNTQAFAHTIATNSTAIGSAAYINNGVYYIRGYFVDVTAQSVLLDPYTNTPSYKVGLQISENIVTPEQDSSLYDNAIGTSNYTAPGAHRFQIVTTLVKKDINDPDTSNFIELLRVKNGIIQKFVNRSTYSEIEKEIARRTYDTNGDYYVKPFNVVVRENLSDGTNNGVYTPSQTTDEGNTPSSNKVSVQISPGTAFVRGFEIETLKSTYIDVDKPRDTNNLTNQSAPNLLGNFVEVGVGTTDTVGMFNLTSGPASVVLYDNYSSSVSVGTGNSIGYGRVTSVEFGTSVLQSNGTVYKVYLADLEFIGGTGTTYKFSDVKSIIQPGSAYVNFSSILNDTFTISGTNSIPVITSGSSGTLTGFISNYTNQLRVGDILTAGTGTSGAIQKFRVSSIASASSATITNLSATSTVAGTYTFTVNRPRLENGTFSRLYTLLPKSTVKTLKLNTLQVRQQKSSLTISTNTITINADPGCIFSNPVASDFVGFDSTGAALNITNVTCNAPFTTATLTTSGNSGTATVSFSSVKSNATERVKTPKLMQVLDVVKTTGTGTTINGLTTDTTNIGTRVEDSIISLGVPDAFKIHAVYESTTASSPVIPNFASSVTSFTAGETISGSTSGAIGRVVSATGSLVYFVYLSQTPFVNGETVTGFTSGSITTVASLVSGSVNTVSNYTLDDGQRDQLYDFSRIVRESSTPTPARRLRIVFDYYDRSASGDYFSVNSYTGVSYDKIPYYRTQSLSDVIDCRLSVNKVVSGSGTVSSPHTVTTKTLDFNSRTSAGISYFNPLKSGSTNTFDLSYYLPRIDKVFLTPDGTFKVVKGQSADIPSPPDDIDNAMLLSRIDYPAYLYTSNGALITQYGNKRYTMRDIGNLEKRIKNVEYYTQLNLLETDTNRMTVTDANGLNRFKNGFLVDNFTDHSKGDVINQDYECSVDSTKGTLRPSHYTTNVPLQFDQSSSTNIQKTGSLLTLPYTSVISIQQPYASRIENVNPFNVFAWIGRLDLSPSSDDWIDTNRLPDIYTSVEGDYANAARLLNADQNGFAPTDWGAWQTTWTGSSTSIDGRFQSRQGGLANIIDSGNRWLGAIGQVEYLYQRETTTTQTAQSRSGIRTQIVPRVNNVQVGDRVVSRTTSSFIRSRNISFTANRVRPKSRYYPFFDGKDVSSFVTPKLIEVTMTSGTFQIGETVVGRSSGCRLLVVAPNDLYDSNPYSSTDVALPSTYSNTSTYLNHDINALSSQVNGSYFGRVIAGETLVGQSSGAVAVSTSSPRLVSDKNGIVAGSFFVPNPAVDTNVRFNVGERTFRLSTNSKNSFVTENVDSSAESKYIALGLVETVQGSVLSVRNSDTVRDTVTDQRTITTTREDVRQIGYYDPLAESFLVTTKGGEYLTGVDLYFQSADQNNIPVSIQIRTVENGTPSKTILPFSDVTLLASNVNTSEDASVPTRFTFPSPVYLQENVEYALVILSDSNSYNVWVSRMGDPDVVTGVVISNQPYTGVLFKSQNASTWSPDQFEDIKFTLYRAQFTSTTGTASFYTAPLAEGNGQILNLSKNPLQLVGSGTSITVLHSNHGMHGTGNSVTIYGAVSEIAPTTLSVGIGTSSISSISVADASLFHNVIGGTGVSSTNPGYIKIDNEIFAYSAVSTGTITISGRAQYGTLAAPHAVGAIVNCYNLNGIPLTQINATNAVINPTLDTYQINVSTPANSTLNGGGSDVKATQNVQYEALVPQFQVVTLPQTSIVARYKGVSAASVDGTETPYVFDSGFTPVNLNDTNYTNAPKLIASTVNQLSKLNNQKSFTIELNMINGGTDNLSPVIDLDRTSIIATSNRVRGNISSISTGSTNPIGDQSKAVYITKLVRLDKSAAMLKVMFSAWRPTPASIDVYYKVLPLNSQANIDSVPYTQFSNSAPLASIPSASDIEIYKDYEFNVDNLNFGAFAIKIVMRSSNQALVPLIKDFRVIALT